MLHACLLPITLCFIHTSRCFYRIPANNLLTRCRSGQFLFSAVFGFRITGNQIFSELEKETILRSFTPEDSRCPKGSRGGPTEGPHLHQARPSLVRRAWLGCGPPGPAPTPPLRLFIPPGWKTLNIARKFQKEVRSRRHRRGEI